MFIIWYLEPNFKSYEQNSNFKMLWSNLESNLKKKGK